MVLSPDKFKIKGKVQNSFLLPRIFRFWDIRYIFLWVLWVLSLTWFFGGQRSKINCPVLSSQVNGLSVLCNPPTPTTTLLFFHTSSIFTSIKKKTKKTSRKKCLSPGVRDRQPEFSQFYWKCKLLIKKHPSVCRLPGGILFTLLLRGALRKKTLSQHRAKTKIAKDHGK